MTISNVIKVKAKDIKVGDVIPLNGFMTHRAEVFSLKETKKVLLIETSMGAYSFYKNEVIWRESQAC